MKRDDLLELGPAALAALANVGFVKRAQKDLAAGRLPTLVVADDGTVEARFDDESIITRLPPNCTLRDAVCNCAASGMCRHRVMLVLTYQARFADDAAETDAPTAAPDWSPADFDDATLAASLAPSVLAQAGELAKAHPVIDVHAAEGDTPPLARLPARHSAGAVRVLASKTLTVLDWYWDAAAQTLIADLQENPTEVDGADRPVLHLFLPHRAATPHAVDALARVRMGEWGALRAVAGPVHLSAGEASMQPLALLTEQRAIVPQVEAAPPQPVALPQGVAAQTQGWHALAGDTLLWLTHLLRQGLRHQAGDMVKQIQERSEHLANAGLRHAARWLHDAGEHWRQAEREKTLEALSTLSLLAMELARRE